jgi:hypothetical protein
MSLQNNINHLASVAGVEAVRVSPGGFVGDPRWEQFTEVAIDLFKHTDEAGIRAVFGHVTAYMQREGSELAVVIAPTGHSTIKSLRRTIRRMAVKDLPAKVASEDPLDEV